MTDVDCWCGHGWEYHGPEVPGCVECRCRRIPRADNHAPPMSDPRPTPDLATLADQWEASLADTFHTEGEAAIVRTHVAQLRELGGV
jgi:hypothetical protein